MIPYMSSFLVPLKKKNYILVLKLNVCLLSIYQAGAVSLPQSRCRESAAGMVCFCFFTPYHLFRLVGSGGAEEWRVTLAVR